MITSDDTPVVLDARPVRLGESRDEIVADLLNSATEIVAPTVVLMDREFDTRGMRGVCETQGLRYLTAGSRVGEQGRIERLDRGNVDVFRDSEPSLAGPDREVLYQRAESDEIQTTLWRLRGRGGPHRAVGPLARAGRHTRSGSQR